MGRAHQHHLSRLHGVGDAAADAGHRHAPDPQPPRGLRRDGAPDPLRRAPPPAPRDDQARLRRPRPLGRRSGARRACPSSHCSTRPMPRAGAPPSTRTRRSATSAGEVDGDTTGFVVADGRGNVLSVIQSLYKGFGSGVVPPGTGVVLQNRGAYFNTNPGHPNCFGPRKHPFHTLIACIVTRDGAARAGARQHGRRRAGDVPHPDPHQRARLRHGDPGGDRAAALLHGPHQSGRRAGPGAAGEPRPRRPCARS